MEDLAEISDDLVTYLNFYIYGVEQAPDPAERGMAAQAVSSHYEAVAICELLLDAGIDAFFHHLIRSAQTRRWLLQQSAREEGYPAKALKASFTRPLFDAIAANQFKLAREIAALSPRTWYPEVEYEDDFCYAHFLHRYLLGDAPGRLTPILDQFQVVLEEAPSARLGLCKVLLSRDPQAGEEAFLRLLDERTEKLDRLKKTSAYWDGRDALLYPNTVIFIEGLAWLRLLEAVGINLDDEYRYCPGLARVGGYAPFQATTFPGLPL